MDFEKADETAVCVELTCETGGLADCVFVTRSHLCLGEESEY